jgi:Uma2 family endonuclease
MSIVVQRHQFTVDDFAKMVEAGILAEDDRVELIDGEVRQMSPIGSVHAAIVNRLNTILSELLVRRAIVSIQNPVILNDYTEPQPDLVVLRLKDDYYREALPGPSDVLLLIEVADTTLEYDRDEKVPRYAGMRVPEVWLVDTNAEEVTQYARPDAGSYQHVGTFAVGEELRSIEISSLGVSISDIFLIGR